MPLGANKAAIMGVAGVSTGDVVLIQSQTASSDASVSFTSGITSTYGEYIFKFYNINPDSETSDALLTFQVDDNAGSNGYNDFNITSTFFRAYHNEADDGAALAYQTSFDLAQSTSFQTLTRDAGAGADESCAGELHLFNPASTTYVKHFAANFVTNTKDNAIHNSYASGYINTTTAINGIQFKMSNSSAFDGTIKMWGVK